MFALVKQAWEKEKLLSFTTAAATTYYTRYLLDNPTNSPT